MKFKIRLLKNFILKVEFPISLNLYVRTHVKFTRVNIYGKSRLNVKVKRGST